MAIRTHDSITLNNRAVLGFDEGSGVFTITIDGTVVYSSSSLAAAELAYLDIATLGTGAASKAVVLDAGEDYVWPATGILTYGVLKDPAGTTLTATAAELNALDITTAGVTQASKAIVLNSSEELVWAVTDAGVGTVTPLDFALTASGAGAEVDGAKFSTTTEVALGEYANGMNAKLDFGAAGKVSGLGGAMCAELDLGPGTTSGSYAVFEAEMNAPASASLGTRTSFFSLNAWGANVAAIDTSALLFDLNGLSAGSGKLFNSGLSQVVTAAARLRVKVGATLYYIPLCAAEALSS
jgi:hypothetical protein